MTLKELQKGAQFRFLEDPVHAVSGKIIPREIFENRRLINHSCGWVRDGHSKNYGFYVNVKQSVRVQPCKRYPNDYYC